MHVTRANGMPAQVVLQLDQRKSTETQRVRYALEELVAVNEWAANPTLQVMQLRERLPEEGESQRVVAQALRLMPNEEDDVQTVELSGRFVPRLLPVAIRPAYAARMLEVIKEDDSEPHSFAQVGIVRAVDIDQRSIRVKGDNKTYKCWMATESLIPIAQETLGKRVHIIGHEYKRFGSDVIIVQAIKLHERNLLPTPRG